MRLRSKLVAGVGGLAAVSAVALFVASSVVAVAPHGDTMQLKTGNFSLAIAGGTVTCEIGLSGGTIPPSNAEPVTLEQPLLLNKGGTSCSSTGFSGAKFRFITAIVGTWKLKAVTGTSGSLSIPAEGMKMTGEGAVTCNVWFGSAKEAHDVTGTWASGTSGSPLATPSTLTFSSVSVPVYGNSGCTGALKEATTASLTATFYATDTANPTEPITLF